MFSLAASIISLTTVQLGASELETLKRISPSLVSFVSQGKAVGTGAFIGNQGLAVVHQLVLASNPTELVTASGERLAFTFVSKDGPSQLALVKSSSHPRGASYLSGPEAIDGNPGTALAVFPGGAVRLEITQGIRVGVDARTNRSVPINELRVEQDVRKLGGALIVSKRGRLIGTIAATLAQTVSDQNAGAKSDAAKSSGLNLAGQLGGHVEALDTGQTAKNGQYQLGPQNLMIGYTPTWEVTSKAISGFLSSTHKLQYGVIGVMVVGNPEGVQIAKVEPASGANAGGLQVGDVITKIESTDIKSVIDFARVAYRLEPHSRVKISFLRNGVKMSATVTVGAAILTQHAGR